MIPNLIHQQFFGLKDRIQDHPVFMASRAQNVELAHENDFRVRGLWNWERTVALLEHGYPEHSELFYSYPHDIQRMDFARMMYLHSMGGYYVDLDMALEPAFFEHMRDNESDVVFHSYPHVNRSWAAYENSFMGSTKHHEFWLFAMGEAAQALKDVTGKPIYAKWKARSVFQTTGPRFLSRCVRKFFGKAVKPLSISMRTDAYGKNIKPLGVHMITDASTNTWVKSVKAPKP